MTDPNDPAFMKSQAKKVFINDTDSEEIILGKLQRAIDGRTDPIDPAFPTCHEKAWQNAEGRIINQGLTKREYFAAMAMQGIISNKGIVQLIIEQNSEPEFVHSVGSKMALAWADALIAELNKETLGGDHDTTNRNTGTAA